MKEYIVPIYDDSPDYDEIFVGQIRNDGVEVVRCKDCKYLGENDGYYFCNAIGIAFGEKPNWFCADGERKDPCSSQDS